MNETIFKKEKEMGKLDKKTKAAIRMELNKIAHIMILEEDPVKLKELMERYKELSDLIKVDWKVSPDTILIVTGNLLGILLILKYEKLDIITSKAIGFVLKGRV